MFLAQSDAEWLQELYEDLYAEREQTLADLKALDAGYLSGQALSQRRNQLMAALRRIAESLEEAMPDAVRDDVLDQFDEQIKAGETVDLQSLLPKGWRPPAEAVPRGI